MSVFDFTIEAVKQRSYFVVICILRCEILRCKRKERGRKKEKIYATTIRSSVINVKLVERSINKQEANFFINNDTLEKLKKNGRKQTLLE